MSKKTVIITGCSSGIGLATAVKLASDQARYKVYATMRNLAKSSELKEKGGELLNKTMFLRELDVTDQSTIDAVVKEVIQVDKKIDVVVNNAGIGNFAILERVNMDTIRRVFETNFLGTVRVTRAVLPYMKKQASGSIINLSSQAGFLGYPFNDAYCASKFAIEGFSESLAPALKLHNIHMCLIEPGFVSTNFVASAMALNTVNGKTEDDDVTDDVSQQQFDTFFNNVFKETSQISESAEEVADVIKDVLAKDEKHLRYQTSEYTRKAAEAKMTDTTGDETVSAMMKYFNQ
ncbi:estradiol 17-beta-dehydrogenase 1-like [Anneissia japonica]|uniref:estradiol 17-beta-dehydrogenase 1-like n=1 Tax=Anneissia japonica TaxID=1529436 RepID=UPI001425A2C3|nr:estradiol 17-beta-dehydrogenase 1-like [Anneissia japonica]